MTAPVTPALRASPKLPPPSKLPEKAEPKPKPAPDNTALPNTPNPSTAAPIPAVNAPTTTPTPTAIIDFQLSLKKFPTFLTTLLSEKKPLGSVNDNGLFNT